MTINLRSGRCFVIAEAGLTHDGSLGLAHALIDAVATTGADAVKFQTHIASAESTLAEPFRVKFSRQDATRYDYWKRMEFSEEQWKTLVDHARDRNLVFLSSPFSVEAADLLRRLGMVMWKIGSGEVSNDLMLDRISETGDPILLSSGMSDLTEMDRVIGRLQARHVPLVVMQCTTSYPCPPEKIGLNMLDVLRQRYHSPVGLSDHSGTIYPSLAAATLGAEVVEVHVTPSREMFGPDIAASVTTTELRQLVDGIRFIECMRAHPVDKDAIAAGMGDLRSIFTKSIVAKHALKAGQALAESDLAVKKPGTGIPAARLGEIVGRRLRRHLAPDEQIREDDLEGA